MLKKFLNDRKKRRIVIWDVSLTDCSIRRHVVYFEVWSLLSDREWCDGEQILVHISDKEWEKRGCLKILLKAQYS